MPVPHPVAGSPFPKVNSFIPIIAQNTNEKKEEGRADHSPPKITMLNNAQLKETLNQKLTTHADEARPIFTTSSRQDEPIDSLTLPTLNIVLTFSVPLADLQGQIERIYSLIQSLGLASSVQYQAKPSLVKPPTPIVIPEPVRATASSPIRVSAVPTSSSTAVTAATSPRSSRKPSATRAPPTPSCPTSRPFGCSTLSTTPRAFPRPTSPSPPPMPPLGPRRPSFSASSLSGRWRFPDESICVPRKNPATFLRST